MEMPKICQSLSWPAWSHSVRILPENLLLFETAILSYSSVSANWPPVCPGRLDLNNILFQCVETFTFHYIDRIQWHNHTGFENKHSMPL